MTDEPEWEAGLAPAVRKRTGRTAAPAPAAGSHAVPPEVLDRLDALERQVQQLRGEQAERFQEIASRAVVLAEATDEILTRHAAALDRVEAALAALPAPDLSALARIETALAASPAPDLSALARIEALLAALPDALPKVDTRALEEAMAALADGLITPVEATVAATIDLKTAIASLAERIDETEPVRAEVELVAERLSTLLGGPTLTELMDRIDELGGRDDEPPPRRRRI